jgi:hypothetical protein
MKFNSLGEAAAHGEKKFREILQEKIQNMNTFYLVFDVESIGLHGQAYAVGGVVIDQTGFEHRSFKLAVNPEGCSGDADDRQWVVENIPLIGHTHQDAEAMRDSFWKVWKVVKEDFPGITMAAECAWPVETNFLSACVRDQRQERKWEGPYPLLEISSVMTAAGMDPMATYDRLEGEQPKHCPLADARQSARLLIEALNSI